MLFYMISNNKHFFFLRNEAFQTSGFENVFDTKFDALRMLKKLEVKSLQPDSELSVGTVHRASHRQTKFVLIGQPVRPRST